MATRREKSMKDFNDQIGRIGRLLDERRNSQGMLDEHSESLEQKAAVALDNYRQNIKKTREYQKDNSNYRMKLGYNQAWWQRKYTGYTDPNTTKGLALSAG